jgi:glycosyltransferase involved in cell wall biosynthesis
VKLAIGVILSSGYKADTEFLFGRPDSTGEGLLALSSRVQTGEANKALPAHLQITDCRTILSRKFPTDVARNEICAMALACGADYLLFLDADMVHPSDLAERLMAAEKPVITARYHLKKAPFSAVAYVKHRTQEGAHRYGTVHFGRGVFEIERGGAGALLIRRDVLQAIFDRQGHNWFRYQRDPKPPHDFSVSEDFWFYRQAREAGFSCWVDWEIDIPHIGPMAIDASWNKPFLHTQMRDVDSPEMRDLVINTTVVRGYPDGMVIGGTEGQPDVHIPEYQVTAGER